MLSSLSRRHKSLITLNIKDDILVSQTLLFQSFVLHIDPIMAGYPSNNPFGTSALAESSTGRTRGPSPLIQPLPTDSGPPPQYIEHVGGTRIPDLPLPERPQEVQAIAVMGPTGSGKSTLISKLGGSAVNIGHDLRSCKCLQQSRFSTTDFYFLALGTQNIVEVRCKIGDRYVMLVDTPGFNDTVRSDTEILGLLVDWMKDSYGERHFSGLIYLHDISGARMTGSVLKNIRMFRKLCGEENLRNVILATTKWAITPMNDAIMRERDLCSDQGFWGLMIHAGSMVRRFDNTEASARSLVEELLHTGNKSFTPKIQREVVVEGKMLSQTDAGAFIEEALAKQAKEHKEEMKSLKEEQERARKKRMRACFSFLLSSES